MKNDQNHDCSEINDSEEKNDIGLEEEEDETWPEDEQKETRPQLVLVKPSDRNIEPDSSADDPPGWPEF
jgi:hypothetical protein